MTKEKDKQHISRRDFLRTSMLGAGGLVLGGASSLGSFGQRSGKPNVLIVMADDMSWHDAGCYGNKDVHTPHIDGLRAQSMKFNQAFSSAPMCAPTRMSLYTGLHPVRNGGHPNHSRVYPHIKSMPHYMRDLGYETAIIGKRHEKPTGNFPFKSLGGVHHDDGQGEGMDLPQTRAFMKENEANPWCLVVASNQPHLPWNRGEVNRYDPDSLSLPSYFVDTPETREALARYYAEITYLDESVGTLLNYLDQTGQQEETIVIFLSEQGSNFPLAKWTCYDRGVRGAMLVRWPGVAEQKTTTDSIVQYVDILPTLIEAAGGNPAVHDFDGHSFLQMFQNPDATHHDYAFSMQTSKGIYQGPDAYGIRSIRSDTYRLVWNLNWRNEFQNLVTDRMDVFQSWKEKARQGNAFARQQVRRYQQRPEFELFQVKEDPFEMNNLAGEEQYASLQDSLHNQLKQWMEQQGDKGIETEMDALNRQSERQA